MVVPRNFVSRKTSFNAAAPGSILLSAKSSDDEDQRMRMHTDEVDISADLVRRLVADQFPLLNDHPVTEFESTGTVNAIYRLGNELYVRLPRVERRWARGLQKELKWLPVLAPGFTLQVPEPVGVGRPTAEYPFTWAIFRWIEQGELKLRVDHAYKLAEAARAHQDLEGRLTTGKLVLEVGS